MTDVAGRWVPDELLDRLFVVFALRHDVTFQVLTKRPERLRAYLLEIGSDSEAARRRWDEARQWLRIDVLTSASDRQSMGRREYVGVMMAHQQWPLPNVWIGTSVENQHFADERIPLLLKTPAAVRFISAEPLLSAVDLTKVAIGTHRTGWGERRIELDALTGWEHHWPVDAKRETPRESTSGRGRIDWVIVGPESGAGRREVPVEAVESIVQQCAAAGVPCFVKQDGGAKPGEQGRLSDAIWAVKQFPTVA